MQKLSEGTNKNLSAKDAPILTIRFEERKIVMR